MEIKTKFDLDQEVYYIGIRKQTEYKPRECDLCNGVGEISSSSKSYTCPQCHGNTGRTICLADKWFVDGASKIGKISVCFYSIDYLNLRNPNEEEYMLEATGIGSGRVWKVKDLFLTFDKAEKECEKRNTVLQEEYINKIKQ